MLDSLKDWHSFIHCLLLRGLSLPPQNAVVNCGGLWFVCYLSTSFGNLMAISYFSLDFDITFPALLCFIDCKIWIQKLSTNVCNSCAFLNVYVHSHVKRPKGWIERKQTSPPQSDYLQYPDMIFWIWSFLICLRASLIHCIIFVSGTCLHILPTIYFHQARSVRHSVS